MYKLFSVTVYIENLTKKVKINLKKKLKYTFVFKLIYI